MARLPRRVRRMRRSGPLPLANGRAVLCGALTACRRRDAGPGPRRGRADHRLTRPVGAAPPPDAPAVTRPAIALQRATGPAGHGRRADDDGDRLGLGEWLTAGAVPDGDTS